MRRFVFENRFDDRMRFEDNKGAVWDSDELDDIDPWEIDGMGLHVAEFE